MSDFSIEKLETSSGEISITINNDEPVPVNMIDEVQSRGYKCGQCCLHCCCTIEYECCIKNGKRGYTPYTISQAASCGTLLTTAISACAGTGMLCCNCLNPYGNHCICNNFAGCTVAYMTAGGFFGLTVLLSCVFITIKGCNQNCGTITNKLGCLNFSRGFDKRN